MDDILRRLGKRIREIRIRRGFGSQENFADYCKMHRTFLGHLETGRKDFRLTTIIRVADGLGITLGELFAGLETEEPLKLKPGNRRGRPDLSRLRKELAVLERSLGRIKDLAGDPPSARVKIAKAAPTAKTRRTSKERT